MDWRKNRVAIGAATFFLLLGLTLWSVNRRNKPPSGSLEVPSIELDEAAITALEITRPEDERVVLSKAGDRWRVTEPLDAQADQGNVKTALNRLRDLEIARIVADRPENYERLQVDDANAVHVVVRAGEDTLAELKVGKYANGMTMLRLGEREEVYGASGSLRYAFDRELKVWRNRRVVEVEPATVESIRFDSGNGAFSFERQEDGWKPIEGKKALGDFDPKTVTSLVSTVTRLIATDFAPEDTSPARAGLNEPKATVTTRVSDVPEPIVLELGASTDDASELYLRRRGNATIYLISTYLGDRLQPDAKAFERSATPPAPPAVPPQGQGTPQLPPEVMRQLQERIREQQQQQR